MKIDEIKFDFGENQFQSARLERNDNIADYDVNGNLSYVQFMSAVKGLNLISEFYDVKAACSLKGTGICAVALGQSVEDAVQKVIDTNPVDFLNSTIVLSAKVDSDIAKFFRDTNLIVAPEFTKSAIQLLETHNIPYIVIKTPLKEYKKYFSDDIKVTPLGTLIQTPNTSELDKDLFRVVSKQKPTVEQIEDAVFAWKVAKHAHSQAIVIAKDLKTSSVSQGLQTASVEFAIDYSCDMSKDAILASDMPVTVHDINVASQGRIGLLIVPSADKDVIVQADKYSMVIITTGMSNISY